MKLVRTLFRYLTWPMLLFGFGGAIITAGAWHAGVPVMLGVLTAAIGVAFLAEHIAPWQPDWNRNRGDTRRDWLHALVNLTFNRASLWLLPLLAWLAINGGLWPTHWPYVIQVLMAVMILDLGIAAAHHASHKHALLWRFHSVHHSPKRLYGLNGLMKHPLHQGVEMISGILPLLLLGIPFEVAVTLPFLASIALLCQHTNADIRTGMFRYLFANAEVHRFHHRRNGNGDINFGLFTNLYDHLMGTFHYQRGAAPRHSDELGIRNRPDYPIGYLAQLREPFRAARSQAS